jgi:SPX domain protein involved in polyphosphate accumulation
MQSFFERYEKKYLITREQGAALSAVLSQRAAPAVFGEYTVQNLYFDTENWDVIRASIEKPLYKEKLRLRCYGAPNREGKLFLELKKKYKGIVYKRRIPVPAEVFSGKSIRGIVSGESSQISRELDFYLRTNPVSEKIYISYRRVAFAGTEDEGLRVTFDTDVRFRSYDLSFERPEDGRLIIPPDMMLMEIKTLGGIPLWLTRALSENGVFPRSFSKYGVCYKKYILKESNEERTVKIIA